MSVRKHMTSPEQFITFTLAVGNENAHRTCANDQRKQGCGEEGGVQLLVPERRIPIFIMPDYSQNFRFNVFRMNPIGLVIKQSLELQLTRRYWLRAMTSTA